LYRRGLTAQSRGAAGCPDILELRTGDFIIIGDDVTNEAGDLPFGATCANGESIVRIPRAVLASAFKDWNQ
jgi:hypothetical protein